MLKRICGYTLIIIAMFFFIGIAVKMGIDAQFYREAMSARYDWYIDVGAKTYYSPVQPELVGDYTMFINGETSKIMLVPTRDVDEIGTTKMLPPPQ